MSWTLICELGTRYEPVDDARRGEELFAPSFAEPDGDDALLIVDELGIEKGVPFRFECRTLRVRRNGAVIYDSMQNGMTDGCGCLTEDGCTAILRRTAWEILILSPEGKTLDRIGLGRCSKRMPRFLSWTQRGTFLVVFLDRSGLLDLVEIDRRGRLLWFLPTTGFKLGVPKSIQLLPSNNILVADEFRHVSLELDRRGNVAWQFGEVGGPSDRLDRLSNPKSARRLTDGTRLISDSRNHRILAVRPDGARPIQLSGDKLCDPSYADMLPNGHCLICDTGNGRVFEIDAQGNTVWQFGNRRATGRVFSYPRSVELIEAGTYVVADTAHNRVVRVTNGVVGKWPISDDKALFWPRCARVLSSGAILIADARHSRVLEVSAAGEVLNELSHDQGTSSRPLHDPHDVRMLKSGHLLVTDSSNDLVIETDWDGRIYRSIGEDERVRLNDPHSAQVLGDGTVLICDTGNNRIVFVDGSGEIVRSLEAIHGDIGWLRLSGPRYAEVGDNGVLVIADTGNNRIVACTVAGEFVWEFSDVPESGTGTLHQPRWAHWAGRDEVIVCDHFNHRIVHVKRSR